MDGLRTKAGGEQVEEHQHKVPTASLATER